MEEQQYYVMEESNVKRKREKAVNPVSNRVIAATIVNLNIETNCMLQ